MSVCNLHSFIGNERVQFVLKAGHLCAVHSGDARLAILLFLIKSSFSWTRYPCFIVLNVSVSYENSFPDYIERWKEVHAL
jgi:hypothetical protein